MKKDELFIGMLCASAKGTGVISWVDEKAQNIYMTDLPGKQHYKVNFDDIDCWLEEELENKTK